MGLRIIISQTPIELAPRAKQAVSLLRFRLYWRSHHCCQLLLPLCSGLSNFIKIFSMPFLKLFFLPSISI